MESDMSRLKISCKKLTSKEKRFILEHTSKENMVKCAVLGCTNYQGKRQKERIIKFLCFPKDPRVCQKWINACGKSAQFNFRIARICSEHFTEQDWRLDHLLLNVTEDKRRLKQGTVPTQNLPERDEPQTDEEVNSQEELLEQAIRSYDEAEVMEISSNFFQAEVGSPLIIKTQQEQEKIKIEPSNNLSNELHNLRLQRLQLQRETTNLVKRVRNAERVVHNMSKIFTKGQIKRLKNPQKNCNWTLEDVSNSISLFTASSTVYQMLWRRKFPLPSPSTLRKWCSTLKLRPGIVISTMKCLADGSFDEKDRLCILAFYEIRLKVQQPEEPSEDGLRPYKFAQMFIVRALVSEWKHVIYYNFDCMMPALILKDIIQRLKDINFTVVAVVTGVGPRKLSFWRDLRIDEDRPSFKVSEDEKVFVFANVPHLIKRLRNKFLEKGLVIEGTEINIDPLSEMLAVEPSELWAKHDLTLAHISIKKVGRHNLQTALQLFSLSVAEAVRKCVAMGKMYSHNAIECSDFIQLVHEWFKVFNSKFMSLEGGQGPLAYGLALEEQNAVISSMTETIKSLSAKPDDEDDLSFRKGILLNNQSLPQFYDYLKEKHNVGYVITNNLNTDDIEHSFGIRKSHRGIAQRPTPLEIKYRLRAAILINLNMKNSG